MALTRGRIFGLSGRPGGPTADERGATMSNHFSAAMLKFPGDDPRLDLTDLFVFASPESPGKTVLIFDVNPFMTGADR